MAQLKLIKVRDVTKFNLIKSQLIKENPNAKVTDEYVISYLITNFKRA